MIAGLFPHRTRRQIKAKFNREDKLNPQAITNALVRRKDIGSSLPLSFPLSLTPLCRSRDLRQNHRTGPLWACPARSV